MAEDTVNGNQGWEERESWNEGMVRLSSAFSIAAMMSCGLNYKEVELLADYCSLLSHCFRSIAVTERLYPWWPK